MTKRESLIGGYQVPKGTIVFIPFTAVHNSIHNWDQPLEFRPERFLASPEPAPPAGSGGGGRGSPSSGDENPAYLPFSAGPRNCVGQNLAWLSVRLELLSRLWFEVDPKMGSKEEVHANQVMALVTKVKGGFHLITCSHE